MMQQPREEGKQLEIEVASQALADSPLAVAK